jgi:protein ImuB
MRAGIAPQRVLVVCCPGWPTAAEDQAAGPGARAFEQVVSAVEEFCPRVEVIRPGVCAIGARGPARYFGGEAALARKIIEAVTGRGIGCQAGLADGLFAARLAAQAGRSTVVVAPGGTAAFLAPYPVIVLESPELDDLLPRLGITTLGEFAALPAAEAANRFGTQGARAHRLARGLDPRPLAPRRPSADLSVQLEFDPPAEQSEPVVFAAKTLADQMHSRLAASGLACVRVQVQAVCEDGREITRLWRHDGLLSALAVAERVRWQLDGWRAGQAGLGGQGEGTGDGIRAGGITLLRLTPDQLVRDEGRQLGLWGDAVPSDRVARAALRVQAMLGHDAVLCPVLAGGRGPAEQVLLVPFGDAGTPPLPADRPWPGKIPAPAPATVYPIPLQARVTDDFGAAVTVTGRAQASAFPARLWLRPPADASGGVGGQSAGGGGQSLAVTSWAGPWPVTERWWDPASSRRQARFQLVTEDGSAWLAVVQDGRWLIEASYD